MITVTTAAFESMCVLALSQGDPSVLVSSLIFKSERRRTYLYEWEATQCLLRAKLEASASIL